LVAPPRCSPNTHPVRESVYLENNREMMPKLYLRLEQTMETNPIYASAGCPKTWIIQNRYGYRYAKICIFLTISLSNKRCLTRLCDLRP
jgi:hypothetical protein